MLRLKENTFYPIIHIIFCCAIAVALATPLKFEGVVSTKIKVCHMLFRYHKDYAYAQTQIYLVCMFP